MAPIPALDAPPNRRSSPFIMASPSLADPHRGCRRRITLSVARFLGMVVAAACTDVLSPTTHVVPAIVVAEMSANPSVPIPGVGGAFSMPASGDQVAPVPLQLTGIYIPPGTQVEVIVDGAISRELTAGLQAFCDLPHMRPSCIGPWAHILVTTPILPAGDNSLTGGAARVSAAWAGEQATSPDSGSSSVYRGAAGGDLWAGRSGFACWYVDNVTQSQGACFTFGGGYTVRVEPQPTVDLDGGGGGGGGGTGEATLQVTLVSHQPRQSGGRASLAASLEVTGRPAADSNQAAPELSEIRWYFTPDVLRNDEGERVPSPFESRSQSLVADPGDDQPVRLDAERVRLPDGRVVGSGLYVGGSSPGDSGDRLSSATTRLAAAADEGTIFYGACDEQLQCMGDYSADAGSFLVSARVNGIPVSASARVQALPPTTRKPIEIVRAAGPNPDGSFTTLEDERNIALEAVVVQEYARARIGWVISDDTTDGVDSPHVVAGTGLKTFAGVGSRPRLVHPAHPAQLDQVGYRYVVRAFIDLGGERIYSDPVVLQQSVVDAIRQQYVEFDDWTSMIPAPDSFTHRVPSVRGIYRRSPKSETGLGEFCITGTSTCTTLLSSRLASFLSWLEEEWTRDLTATSIFRDPLHHHRHLDSPQRNDSPHKYGTAIDYDAPGDDHATAQKLYWSALRNTGLRYPHGVCAETWYLKRRDGSLQWAGDHVHFDRRYPRQSPCLATWKKPEDLAGQFRIASLGRQDTLVALLSDPDFDDRFGAASILSQLPDAELPEGTGLAALSQLRAEIDKRQTGAPLDRDEYGAYLMELARLVHRSEDPEAAPALARLGIEVSLGMRRFVARHASATIPVLDASWSDEEAMHADIIGTFAEMLRLRADSGWVLSETEEATIDRAFLRAVVATPIAQWGVAFHAGQLELVEYLPLVLHIAALPRSTGDPDGLVMDAAQRSGEPLQRVARMASVKDLVPRLRRLQRSLCHDAVGERLGQCTALLAHLRNAERHIAAESPTPARQVLTNYLRDLREATARAVFTPLEHDLLAANAERLMEKLP